MKLMFSMLFFVTTSLSTLAQTTNPTLTVILRGTYNRELIIDGKDYTPYDVNTLVNATVVITDLLPGQHQFEVTREGSTVSQDNDISTTITLRSNYDKRIIVAANGSLQQSEFRKTGGIANTGGAMSSTEFNALLQTVKRKTRTYDRRTELVNAFENTSNKFSTAQVRQLLLLVSSQRYRLELAKMGLPRVVDPNRYNSLVNLFTSTSSRNDFTSFVRNYRGNDGGGVGNNDNTGLPVPMTEYNFNTLYTGIQNESSIYTRNSMLEQAFSNNLNYFSTAQVRRLVLLVNDENSRLNLLKASYRTVTDPANFYMVYDLLGIQANRTELANYIRGNVQNGSAMSLTSFNTLYQNLSRLVSSARPGSLSNSFQNTANFFTSSQVRQLLLLIAAESDRLALAKISYRAVVDPANFTQVFDVLNSTNSRNELQTFVNNYYGGAYTVKTAMADTEFRNLYRSVQYTFGIGAKFSALTDIFNNANYYFTVTQAEQLIRLVSDEDNRLTLAKAAYSHLTDPQNLNTLFDMFENPNSVELLKAYVATK